MKAETIDLQITAEPQKPARSRPQMESKVNDLEVKEFMRHKRSWFVIDAGSEKEWQEGLKKEHPATYPQKFARWMLECYTKRGYTVLDPFNGTGTTVIAAAQMGRRGIGIDLNEKFLDISGEILGMHSPRARGTVGLGGWMDEQPEEAQLIDDVWAPEFLHGDALTKVREMNPDSVDYVLTSPPYADFLHRNSGGVVTRHKKRAQEGLATTYSDHEDDIGNWDKAAWMDYMVELADDLHRVVRPERYMTIELQNEMRVGLDPIAWRLAIAIEDRTDWNLRPEQIWCQSTKPTTIHGWPKTFTINNHHHYCLNFYKEVSEDE